MVSTDIGIWVAAILTLSVYTYFLKFEQNVVFRFAQSTLIGLSLGYIVVLVTFKNLKGLVFDQVTQGNLITLIPLVIGLLLYSRLIPGYEYLARIPVSFLVAAGLGFGARAAINTQVFSYVYATSRMLILGVDPLTAISNLILVIGMICGLMYFYFSVSKKMMPVAQPVINIGRVFLMIYFGTKFGTTITYRLSLLLGRIQFLLVKWLQM